MEALNVERSNTKTVEVIPFDSINKSMAVVVALKSGYRLYVTGASEVILRKCTRVIWDPSYDFLSIGMSATSTEYLSQIITDYSLRTIGLAYRDFEQWPPSSVQLQIAEGNETKANAIFEDLSCSAFILDTSAGDTAMEGAEFRRLSTTEMDKIIPHLRVLPPFLKSIIRSIWHLTRVLARSSSQDKRTLVTRLKELGEVVAMTGDRTNDALALKAADVSFSMGVSGTEVAREASSIVLMDDNFASMVISIMWGRAFQITVTITSVMLTAISAMANTEEQSLWRLQHDVPNIVLCRQPLFAVLVPPKLSSNSNIPVHQPSDNASSASTRNTVDVTQPQDYETKEANENGRSIASVPRIFKETSNDCCGEELKKIKKIGETTEMVAGFCLEGHQFSNMDKNIAHFIQANRSSARADYLDVADVKEIKDCLQQSSSDTGNLKDKFFENPNASIPESIEKSSEKGRQESPDSPTDTMKTHLDCEPPTQMVKRKTVLQQIVDLKACHKFLRRDLQNRCERVVELELSLDEEREKYQKLLHSSKERHLFKKIAFFGRNIEHLTNGARQLSEQNRILRKEAAIKERKLIARDERIKSLEALSQGSQEKLAAANHRFEVQVTAIKERLDAARIPHECSHGANGGNSARRVQKERGTEVGGRAEGGRGRRG
ncbi:uncharacterized protein PAC_12528 [Phialocephala subalpina]|uniref:Uncharacterized protein n=1 Tax=Phialocephala subalpina TaxID=576137 RepID=A0A1L7XC75_9HELO|nr:uncharacterized protein PAC_12528 [Phialocephala subalpina]